MWTFHTIYHSKIWGGRYITKLKGIEPPFDTIGESWELSVLPGYESVIKNGPDTGLKLPELVLRMGPALLGKKNYERFGNNFPLLIKFIDASSDLSVQVHPDDKMAMEEGLPHGKTELWYVVSSKPGAKIANGFISPVDPADYYDLLKSGKIEESLKYIETEPGMSFFIPAGRVHAIGGGNLICEIQQSSDTTYRIYDYNRRDANGNLRELHTEKAYRALDFNDCNGDSLKPVIQSETEQKISECEEFKVNLLESDLTIERDYANLDSFVILIAIRGDVTLKSHDGSRDNELYMREGEVTLVPATCKNLTIQSDTRFKLLEVYI